MPFPALLLAAAHAASGGEPRASLEDACNTFLQGCRRDVTITLRREKGEPYEARFDLMPPPLQGDLLALLPGETVHLAGKREADRLVDLRLVEAGTPGAIKITFAQRPDAAGMTLTVENPHDRTLRYRAGAQWLDGPEELKSTSSCPVRAGLMSFEMWPQPIFQLAMTDFEFLDGDDDSSCR